MVFQMEIKIVKSQFFFSLQLVLFVLIPMTLDFLRWTIIGPLPEILCSTSVWIKNVIFSNVCIINFAKVSFICPLSNIIFFAILPPIHGTDHGPMMTRSQCIESDPLCITDLFQNKSVAYFSFIIRFL